MIRQFIFHFQTGVERFDIETDIFAIIGKLSRIVGVDFGRLDRAAEIAPTAAIKASVIEIAIIVAGAGRENRRLAVFCTIIICTELSGKRPPVVKSKAAGKGIGLLLADIAAVILVRIFAVIGEITTGGKCGD